MPLQLHLHEKEKLINFSYLRIEKKKKNLKSFLALFGCQENKGKLH